MATIRTAIQIQDRMSPAFKSMNTAMNIVLNTFEKIQGASSEAIDTKSIQSARNELAKANIILDQTEQEIYDANNAQNQFNKNLSNGVNSSNNLLDKVKQIALTIGGLAAIKNVLDLSDEVASNQARLSLIVDDGGSIEELENKIFASANRTRSDYLDTANVISKLGILAGDNFKNTDEMVAFTELMNKNFKIGGASIQEQTSAMYQLTQAMAAGKLQGDEFRSIMENAPLLAETIADYTGKTKGELKELSSDGVITAEVIKKAMFAAADETNERFEKMPLTYAQIWTKMKNIAIKTFEPVLEKLNSIANNPEVQASFQDFVSLVSVASQAILGLAEGAMWLYNILEPFAPVILGIVGAYIAFNIIAGITSGILSILSLVQGVQAAASMLQAGATFSATAAQLGLNTALYACPIVWIVALIFALIVALAYLWFTNDKVAYAIIYAWDSLVMGAMVLWLGCQAVFYGLILLAQFFQLGMVTVCYGVLSAWYWFLDGLEGVRVDVLSIFQGMYNGILDIINRNYKCFK